MPSEKYTKTYLNEQLPAEIREHLREDDLDPTRLPTYDYLEGHGFETRGLTKAIQRHFGESTTLQQHLKKQGFGHGDNGDWPTQHQETIKLLNRYRKSRIERNGDKETTVSTMESAMRMVLRTLQDLHDTDNLLTFSRYEEEQERWQCNKQIEALIDHLKQHKSDGAAENYTRYFKEFYNFSDIRTRIDHNPVEEVEGQYDFDATPENSAKPLDDEQIQRLWQTAKQLPDRHDLTETIANLTTRHGLKRWQIAVMTLLLLGVAVGPRSIEYERSNCREDWHFTNREKIEFPERKNQPGEVPILAHPGFLSAYREYMEKTQDDWNGKPFPSTQSDSGSKTKATLNNWLAALCEEAGVTLEDGSYPTLQNLRQTWHTQYLETLRINDVRLKWVANDAGTKSTEIIDESYVGSEEELETIRDLVNKDFESILPLSELPEEMSRVIDEEDHFDTQKELDEF